MLKTHKVVTLFLFFTCMATVSFAQDDPVKKEQGVNIIITQSPKIIVTVEGIKHNECFGDDKGSIDISAEGGFPPYLYYWSNGDTTQDVAGLKQGIYKVAVYDNFSCSDTVTVQINEPLELLARVASVKDILCYGYNQGELDVEVEGGVAPYQYSWSNGAVTQDLIGVVSGRYSLLITDANNCQEIITADIEEKPLIVRSIDDVENIKCFGEETGTIDISVEGGVPPYQYIWSNGETTQDLSNLIAGTYEVTVMDAQGCTEVSVTKVVQPDELAIDLENARDIRCYGDNGGAINIGVSGGTAPFTYIWNNGATSQDIAGINAGTYSVSVTDANGCSQQLESTITQPIKLDVSLVSAKDVTFHDGSNGSIDIEASGGVPPYTYNWNSGSTTQDISDLKIGNYSAKVTDATGCSNIINVTINQPAPLFVRIDKTENIDCYGNENGTISITVNGGVTPYSYLWNSGQTEEDITGLKAGRYTATITDANGFSQTVDTLLIQPEEFIVSVNDVIDINCYGVNEGAVDIEVGGGSPPYKYHWSNGMITQDINDVPAGDYTVKIMDANRCEKELSATIAQPDVMVTEIEEATNVACNGDNTGAINITVTGGVEPYQYAWNNGNSTQDLSSIAAGTYAVTITDARGCSQILEKEITEPVKLLVQEERVANIDCFGNESGEISLIVSGGITPYTYTWNNGADTKNISQLTAGNYSVTITDGNGCVANYATTLTQPDNLQASVENVTDNLCFGENKGEVNINVTGGVTPYTYRWSNGATSQDINSLKSGEYSVEIRDANKCLISVTATVQENPLLETTIDIININCNGENSGSINLTATGGVPPYNYQWSNGATTQDINGLRTGQYSVIVADAVGCSKQIDAHVIEPSRFVAILESEVDVKCYGESTGSINIRVSGGTLPYTYSWNNDQTTKDLANIPAGNYTLTVADASGCTQVINTTITQPTQVIYEVNNVTNLSCNSDNSGAIDISITGGIGPYEYIWSNGATSQDIVGVPAGNYTVTISEANGCSKTLEATITEPPALDLTLDNVTQVLCNGNSTGAINVTTVGGVAPYRYSWSHGSTSEDVSGLVASKYTVTVTDVNGCSKTLSTEVEEPAPFVAELSSVTHIMCSGEQTGEIKLNVRGGVRPYKFAWNNSDTTQNLSNLGVGTYTVNITDKNGCTQTISTTVTQPEKLVVSMVASSDVSCSGGTNGSINITVVGGVTPYQYNWSNGSSLQDLNNIPAGTYSVGVSDANGCNDSTIVVTITEPEKLVTTLVSIDKIETYGLSTGAIDISARGGTAPYSYSWSNGATTQDISAVPSGNYSVRIVDSKGCEEIINAFIEQPPSLDVEIVSVVDILCFGNQTGAIDVNVTGGVSPYIYEWNNGDSTKNISNVPAGDYSLTVIDANSHRMVVTANISEPTPINVTVDNITHILCQGDESGSVLVSVTGGVSPYKYIWNHGAATKDLNSIPAGSYSLNVTDENGCSKTIEVEVNEPETLTARIVNTKSINCNGDNQGEVSIEVAGGATPYTYRWSNGARTQDISEVLAGSYSVHITDANGCFRDLSTVISEPPTLTASITEVNDNLCNGEENGSISLNVAGGAGSYSYIWSHGSSTKDVTNLIAGDYSVIVRDSLGCEQRLSASITEPTKLLASVENITDVLCNGESNGAVTVNVSGGSAPYTYAWSNDISTQNLSNVPSGNYTLSVTDAKGCEISISAEVKEPSILALDLNNVQNNLCAFDNKGLVDITVSGGVTPYTYTWSNGSSTEDLVNVISDTYSVQVKDANGCINNLTVDVTEPELLTVAVDSVATLNCNGDQNGYITLNVQGGVEPYSYFWNTASVDPSLENVPAGEYQVQVTDANGCINNLTTAINQPPGLIKTIDAITDIRCFGDSTGAVHVTALEGTAPYTFEWSNGETTEDISGLVAGVYTLTITEANGCVSTLEATVEEPTLFAANLESVKDVTCFGDEAGAIDISVTGGVAPYTFAWSNGETTEDISDLSSDNYSVMVTDANGCLNTISTSIGQPTELALKIDSVNNVKCCGDSSGAIFISVTGGAAPYNYEWSNGATTQDIQNLVLGKYTVNVTDANGCTITNLDEDQLNLYEQVVTQGKFTTRDILFDIGRATIKSESFTAVNRIATLMKEHPDLTFRIDGHTDSDGSMVSNLNLSEDRAVSIKRALIKFGIGENRIFTKGWGESQPIATNTTQAGKAQNRRVEFISLTGTLTGKMIENSFQEEIEQ